MTPTERVGPSVTLQLSCFECAHCKTKSYSCQGDSGTDIYCGAMDNKTVGDTCWKTPDWCPFRAEAIRTAIAEIHLSPTAPAAPATEVGAQS